MLGYAMGSINSRGQQLIPANGARLTMIFEQRVPAEELEVINYYCAPICLDRHM